MDELELRDTDVIDESEEEEIVFKYSITSYGADYPVDSLVKRIDNHTIEIPGFQRNYVWTLTQASRFIESLLLGLPVPGIFLSKETGSSKLKVIDGQQRLKTLQFFYQGIFEGKEFLLKGVQNQFAGKKYNNLETEERERLGDSIIHATIVKQDEPTDDESSIYHVFERLNTGGTLLKPQEIRACIYEGPFNDLLSELNDNSEWRNIYGKVNNRKKDQEFILRFFSFYFFRQNYEKPLKGFMNTYMAKNRNLKLQGKNELVAVFEKTVRFLSETLGKKAFRPKTAINASIFDSVMVGVAERLKCGDIKDKDSFKKVYFSLLDNPDFQLYTSGGTSDPPVVEKRMELTIETFKNIS
ncbi:MAG: DUF262 domain-containing protein [Candidatus Aminicenantes bacterium]|jgi:uncharacterized protein with ParB-like and HNH nuclease domain